MGSGTAALITGFSIVFIFLAYSSISSYFYGKKLRGLTVTRGMSGTSGQTVNLQCSPGQVISFNNTNITTSRGVLLNPAAAGTGCDPFFTPTTGQSSTFFNPSTTMDLMASGSPFNLQQCAGQNSCTFTVPLTSDTNITSTCLSSNNGVKQISFIGTYDCVYAG